MAERFPTWSGRNSRVLQRRFWYSSGVGRIATGRCNGHILVPVLSYRAFKQYDISIHLNSSQQRAVVSVWRLTSSSPHCHKYHRVYKFRLVAFYFSFNRSNKDGFPQSPVPNSSHCEWHWQSIWLADCIQRCLFVCKKRSFQCVPAITHFHFIWPFTESSSSSS